jgi:hypothetical protein
MSALQYTFVKPGPGVATGPQARLVPCTGVAGEMGFVLQNKPKQYTGGVIRVYGFSECKVDGTVVIAPGDKLKANASGLGIKTVTAGDTYSAIAFEASSAVGDIIEVLCDRGSI